MLSAADPLPLLPRRILVAELDGLFHGPNWEPRADFADDVDRLTQAPGWVTEWRSMSRLIRRTVFSDPDHIIRWGWRTRNKLKTLVPALDSKFPQLCVVRLPALVAATASSPSPSHAPTPAPATDRNRA